MRVAREALGTAALRDGAQGRDRTTDTVIFSHVLYQLSYLGPLLWGIRRIGSPEQRAGSLTVATIAVHPFGIDRWTGNTIAFAEPFQEVAILAAAAAERRVIRRFRLAAQRA